VCGPFVARGDKGEEEYPYHWLGGTSEVSTVDEWELHRVWNVIRRQVIRQWYALLFCRVEGFRTYAWICILIGKWIGCLD
jgi:hypothetical protein